MKTAAIINVAASTKNISLAPSHTAMPPARPIVSKPHLRQQLAQHTHTPQLETIVGELKVVMKYSGQTIKVPLRAIETY